MILLEVLRDHRNGCSPPWQNHWKKARPRITPYKQ
jgi:hypothetical protein